MLRIIFYLIFLIILSYGISNFKKDKAKDEPAKPIGDHFLNKINNMNENCNEDMEKVIGFFRKNGHFSEWFGLGKCRDFIFNKCEKCNRLKIAGQEEDKCREDRMNHETVEKMMEMVDQSDSFEEFLEQFIKVWCRECDRIFASRLEREEHGKSTHSRENPMLVEKDLS